MLSGQPKAKEFRAWIRKILKALCSGKARIGRLANQNGLKTEQYGKMVWDKSPHSAKQVQSFVYNSQAVERFRALLGQ